MGKQRYRVDSSGKYSTAAAMESSNSEFSGNFYLKFAGCSVMSLCVVGCAFFVMNNWLNSIPAHARGPMMQGGGGAAMGGLGGGMSAGFGAMGGGGAMGGAMGGGSPLGGDLTSSVAGDMGLGLKGLGHAPLSDATYKGLSRVKHFHVPKRRPVSGQ